MYIPKSWLNLLVLWSQRQNSSQNFEKNINIFYSNCYKENLYNFTDIAHSFNFNLEEVKNYKIYIFPNKSFNFYSLLSWLFHTN